MSKKVDQIINASWIEIPFDHPNGIKWYMKQPTDRLYDDSLLVQNAEYVRVKAMPEIQAIESLGPSEEWLQGRKETIKELEKKLKELERKRDNNEMSPDEADELAMVSAQLDIIRRAPIRTRADEVANRRAAIARDRWLVQRLVVDENGNLLFDPETDDGRKRWSELGIQMKDMLNETLHYALVLVQVAKNSPRADRES